MRCERNLSQSFQIIEDDMGVDAFDILNHTDQIGRARFVAEEALIKAVWTLRKLPDKEAAHLYARGTFWPDMSPSDRIRTYSHTVTELQTRKSIRTTPRDIDRMIPVLDLLSIVPDLDDRRILFWASWHQDGEKEDRIPWAKVRRSMNTTLSRWSLKRRHSTGLDWIARLAVQKKSQKTKNNLHLHP